MKRSSVGAIGLGLVVAIVATLAVRHSVIALRFPYPIEYPEGITAHWTQQAAAGASLYPEIDPAAPLHNPYPPLFYRLAAPLQHRFDNPFLAARLTALAGLIACAGAIAWLLRSKGIRCALTGALLFALSTTVLRYGTTARVDLPALALALASIAALPAGGCGWRAGLAGLLAGGAWLTKPSFIAAAAAGLLVNGRRGWRPMACWSAGFAAALALGLTLFGSTSAHVALHLWTVNQLPWEPSAMGTLAARVLSRHPILVAGLVLFLVRGAISRDASWWYAVFAVPCIAFAGKIGADENYLLELIAVACVGTVRLSAAGVHETPPAVPDPEGAMRRAWSGPIAPLLAAVQVLLYLPVAPAPVFTRTYEQELAVNSARFTPSAAETEAGARVVTELRNAGTVLSQSPGLMIAAGRAPTWDAYQFTQRARAGSWDDAPMAAAVERGAFDLVLMLSDPAAASNYFPPRVRAAVDARYTLHRDLGPWRLLRPK